MFRIQRLVIEEAARDDPVTRRVRRLLAHLPAEIIPTKEALRLSSPLTPGDITKAKETLLLARQKGPFWRSCPGTKEYICCGYQILQVMTNCPMDCSYCVLQSYLNFPAMTVFTNWDDLWVEMEVNLAARTGAIQRLGTGEFGDSLALDELLGLNRKLIDFIRPWPNAVLEIKTKWHRVEPLCRWGPTPGNLCLVPEHAPADPPGRARRHPLEARLAAARTMRRGRFPPGLSFRPADLLSGMGRGISGSRGAPLCRGPGRPHRLDQPRGLALHAAVKKYHPAALPGQPHCRRGVYHRPGRQEALF